MKLAYITLTLIILLWQKYRYWLCHSLSLSFCSVMCKTPGGWCWPWEGAGQTRDALRRKGGVSGMCHGSRGAAQSSGSPALPTSLCGGGVDKARLHCKSGEDAEPAGSLVTCCSRGPRNLHLSVRRSLCSVDEGSEALAKVIRGCQGHLRGTRASPS